MNVMAIDPGTEQSAVLSWDGERVISATIMPNLTLLHALSALPREQEPDVIGIEMIASYGMSVGREVFETCVMIGRFFERAPITPRLIYRRDVKLHHCQSARAKDTNIRQALIDKYGAPGTKKNPGALYGIKSHLWAALAIATFITETEAGNNHHEKAFSASAQI
jgi:hypothetical protein